MIFVLIIVFGLLTFVGFMFFRNFVVRWIIGGLSFVILALSVGMLTLHIKDNWGMKNVTTQTSHQIFTAGDKDAPYGLMIKSEIGKDTGNYVLIFRNDENSAKYDINFTPDQKHIVEAVKKTATYKLTKSDTAKVVTTTTRREFGSNLMKSLFDAGNEQNDLVKKRSVVYVPRDTWLVLTADQVKKLEKESPAMQAQMQAELKANPAKAAQLAELQKSNPQEYAKMQVQQIKQLLGIKK